MKASVITVGCPKNLVDSEQALHILHAAGYAGVEDPAAADLILVNTCAFIASAREESVTAILDAAAAAAPGARLLVTGCMVARYAEELPAALPEVDAFVGLKDWEELWRLLAGKGPLPCGRKRLTSPWTGYLRIADGCNNCCSYCAIPSIRGGYVSRPFEELLDEAAAMGATGVRELILIAQDSTRYGMDLYGRRRLVELMQALSDLKGLDWIRLLYAHPASLDDELMEMIAQGPRICRYLELPLQHSHPDILASMGRPADSDAVLAALHHLRRLNPEVTLRSTFITGYPGERDEHYRHLRRFLGEAAFDRAGFFVWSAEEGTRAADIHPRVRCDVAGRRQDSLMELQRSISAERAAWWIGRTAAVLVEECDRQAASGRSHRDAPDIDGRVSLSGEPAPAGSMVRARITHSDDYDLYGIIEV